MALSERRRIVYRFMELPHTLQHRLLKEFDLIAEDAPFLSREDRAIAHKVAFELIAERGILEAFGLTTAVEPVDSSFFPRAAPTPNCEMLENLNIRFLGLEHLGPWQDAMHRYVASL